MPASRIILGSLVAASIRHGIFTIALPWLILYRTDGLEEMRFSSGNDTRPIWSEGAHGWSRNPLLLGVLIILLGECLAFESLALLAYLAFYWLWLTLYLVLAEEPALRRTLGSEYASYCRHVPRWFLHFHSRKKS